MCSGTIRFAVRKHIIRNCLLFYTHFKGKHAKQKTISDVPKLKIRDCECVADVIFVFVVEVTIIKVFLGAEPVFLLTEPMFVSV